MSYPIKNVISSSGVPDWGNQKKYIAIHYLGVDGQNYQLYDGCGAHYYIYWDGAIYQRCSHDAVPWQVGTAGYYTQLHPYANNYNCIGIEMCCHCDGNAMSAEDPYWYFTTETQEACVQLVKKLMKELNIPASNVLRHADIVNKTCPAPYVKNNKYKTSWTWGEFKAKISDGKPSDITTDANNKVTSVELYRVRKSWEDVQSQLFAGSLSGAKEVADGNSGYNVYNPKGVCVYPEEEKVIEDNTAPTLTPAPTKVDKVWLGWTVRESGKDGFRQTNGDAGNANGKYQFDRRYALVPFMQYCIDYNFEHYSGFATYIAYGAGSYLLQNNYDLATLWKSYCNKYPKEFEALQDAYAYKYYYLEAKKYMKNLYGINMDDHSPAVKGSLFSMAIRSGALSGAYKFEGCDNKTSDEEMLKIAYGNYGSADANRWTISNQYGDALSALKNNEYTAISVDEFIYIEEVKTEDKSDEKSEESTVAVTPKQYYRIATGYKKGEYINQKYAFEDKDKALKQVKLMSSEYKVFDPDGKQVYPKKSKSTSTKQPKKLTPKYYRVQIGRYLVHENAKRIMATLKKKGFDAMIVKDGAEEIVQAGLFKVEDNANNLAAQIGNAGLPVAVIPIY